MEVLCARGIALLEKMRQEILRRKLTTAVTLRKFPEATGRLDISEACRERKNETLI
jgi:hypothetical protein